MVFNSRDNEGRMTLCFYLKIHLLAAGITNIMQIFLERAPLVDLNNGSSWNTKQEIIVVFLIGHSSVHSCSAWWTTVSLTVRGGGCHVSHIVRVKSRRSQQFQGRRAGGQEGQEGQEGREAGGREAGGRRGRRAWGQGGRVSCTGDDSLLAHLHS